MSTEHLDQQTVTSLLADPDLHLTQEVSYGWRVLKRADTNRALIVSPQGEVWDSPANQTTTLLQKLQSADVHKPESLSSATAVEYIRDNTPISTKTRKVPADKYYVDISRDFPYDPLTRDLPPSSATGPFAPFTFVLWLVFLPLQIIGWIKWVARGRHFTVKLYQGSRLSTLNSYLEQEQSVKGYINALRLRRQWLAQYHRSDTDS